MDSGPGGWAGGGGCQKRGWGQGLAGRRQGRPTGPQRSFPALIPFAPSGNTPKWAEHGSAVQGSWISGLALFLPVLDFCLRVYV